MATILEASYIARRLEEEMAVTERLLIAYTLPISEIQCYIAL